jgi:adenylate kinase family enzyme
MFPTNHTSFSMQVKDDDLVERVVGRRLDPVTGNIYHMTYNKPPAEVVDRLVQRSDDTEDKLRNRLAGHHKNVEAVVGYYQDELTEVGLVVNQAIHSLELKAGLGPGRNAYKMHRYVCF